MSSDQRVVAVIASATSIPDLSVVCAARWIPELGANERAHQPDAPRRGAVELDRAIRSGLKWEGYQRIESLTDYVLVSQTAPRSSTIAATHADLAYQFAAAG